MQIETLKRLFTVREYHQMAETGILGPKDRTELIDGEVIQMSPIGHRHGTSVTRTTYFFTIALQGRAIVHPQGALVLNDYSEPQPDVMLLKFRDDFYRDRDKVSASDVWLVVEVSETNLHLDIDVKLPRYAAAGVPEVWIEDLNEDRLLVFRDLIDGAYTTSLTLQRSDSVSVAAFPDIPFKVDDLIG